MLNNRYGLNFSISEDKKGLYKIIIDKEFLGSLITIISPFIIPNMKYKIGIKTHLTSCPGQNINKGKRFYTTNNLSANPLNPYFVTGFADGESNFTIIITENKP